MVSSRRTHNLRHLRYLRAILYTHMYILSQRKQANTWKEED